MVGGREAAQGPGRGTNGVVDAGKVRGSQQAGGGKEQKLKDLLRIAQHAYARKLGWPCINLLIELFVFIYR